MSSITKKLSLAIAAFIIIATTTIFASANLRQSTAQAITSVTEFLGLETSVNTRTLLPEEPQLGDSQASVETMPMMFNPAGTGIVISEIYGGGGNSGATYQNDFVELYNPTNAAISVAGWSVQQASASGSTWSVTNLSGSVPSRGYYLVKWFSQGAVGATLPAADVTNLATNLGSSGKVALMSNTTALTCGVSNNCTAVSGMVDFVGFGASVSSFEGSAGAGTPGNTSSLERKAASTSTGTTHAAGGNEVTAGNGYDTDNNNTDFVVQSTTISPQNTSSATEPAAPTVTAISPASGTSAGGTSVTITGTNFIGVTGVTIGGNAATSVTVVSNTSITALTPAGTNGSASVVVTTSFGSNAANTLFTYGTDPTDYFRSRVTGDWNTPATWESAHLVDFSDAITATIAPTIAANTVTIRNGHTVSNAASVTLDQVVIESGGVLNYTNTVLTIANGAGDDITIQSGGVFNLANSTVPTLSSGSTVSVETGGIVRISTTSATNLTASGAGVNSSNFVYKNASILEIAANTASTLSASTYFPNVDAATIPIFRVSASGSGFTGTSTVTVNGVVEVNAAFGTSGSGTKIFRNGIRGSATFTQNTGSGQIQITGATAELGGAGTIIALTNGMSINSGSVTTLTSNKTINFGTLTVNGTLNCGTSALTGTGLFTLASTGTLGIGSPDGIRTGATAVGNIQVVGTRTYSASATYVYNGTAAQMTGSGLPATGSNSSNSPKLSITNTAGVVTLSQSMAVGTSSIGTGASFSTGAFILTIPNAVTLTNNGTFTVGSSTGAASLSGTFSNAGTAQINGTLQMVQSAAVWSGTAPTYASGSLLNYFYAGVGSRGAEWTPGATTQPGYPNNVNVNGTLNLVNGATTPAFQISGNLTGPAGTMDLATMGQPLTVLGNVTLLRITNSATPGADLKVGGNFTLGNTYTHNGRTLEFNGSGPQTWSDQILNNYGNVKINNSSGPFFGVTLIKPINVQTLDLAAGMVTTTATNVLSVTDASPGAISGGSNTSFVIGPLNRRLPANLSSDTGVYAFPVGQQNYYLPASLTNVSSGATAPVAQLSAGVFPPGGFVDNTTVTSISSSEYWSNKIVSGDYSNGSISLTRPTPVGTFTLIAASASLTGTHSSIGGTAAGNSINNAVTGQIFAPSTRFYRFGALAAYQLTTAVSPAAGGSITAPATSPTTVNHAAPTTITAVANPGYVFTGWTLEHFSAGTFGDANALSTTVTLIGDATATANFALPPTVGNYDPTAIGLSGNATVTPDAVPTNATSMSVTAPTGFIGELTADPVTGVVRITNASLAKIPAGAYPITVRAINSGAVATTTFNLTVSPTACTATSGFAAAVNHNAGSFTFAVAVGDFNNDGNQDLAAANQSASSVSILIGNGTGGFDPAVNYTSPSPYSIAVGDFNGDGKQDLVTSTTSPNTVSVLIGNGSGGFAAAVDHTVGMFPNSVAVGDFNGDGKHDIATADTSGSTVSVLIGNGAGGFATPVGYNVGLGPISIAVGDFDGDGDQDLATANSNSNNVSVLIGNGTGGFAAATSFAAGTNPFAVAMGDFDGDGDQDLATANNGSDNVSVLIGNGAGGFAAAANHYVETEPRSLAVGDFNGDGKQDLVTVSLLSNNVSVLIGDGTGGFAAAENHSVGFNPRSVTVGDFNADGRQDLAAANGGSNDVSVLAGTCVVSSFTVTFDANGGTGTMADQTASAPTALTANDFTRTGYAFTGWNTVDDGSGTAYADEESYPFTADVTLYAQWTALPADTPTVTNTGLVYTGGAHTVTVTCASGNAATAISPSTVTNAVSTPVTASCPGGPGHTATSNVFAGNVVVAAATPTLSFTTTPTNPLYEGGNFTINPIYSGTDASVTYTYSSAGGGSCTRVGGAASSTFHPDSAGDCSITVVSSATDNFTGQSATQTVSVGKGTQTVSFSSIAPSNATVGGATYNATATGGASGNGVSIASTTPSVCTGSDTSGSATITFVAAGTCTIRASQLGNSNYEAATPVDQTFSVTAPPTIGVTGTLNAFSTTYGTASAVQSQAVSGTNLTADITATAPAGYEVSNGGAYGSTTTFAQSSGTASGTLSIRLAGPTAPSSTLGTTLSYTSTGATTQNVTVSGSVAKNTPIVTVTDAAGPFVFNDNPQGPSSVTVPTASGGVSPTGSVIFQYIGTGATNYPLSTTKPTNAGTYTVDAQYPGDVNYTSAASGATAFSIGKGSQTVSFTSTVPSNAVIGGAAYSPTATGGASGNDVSIASTTTGVCTGSGTSGSATITFVGAGTCIIRASQLGNSNYEDATPVDQTFSVAAATYTVTFNANGGSGTMANQTTNAPTALTANAFTRTGYTFSGWNTVVLGGGTAYANGATYPFTANATLYAQWTATQQTVTYDLNGGGGITTPIQGNVATDATFIVYNGTAPTKAGFTFAGWNDGTNTYLGGATYTMGVVNVTLTAVWTPNTYTLSVATVGSGSVTKNPDQATYSNGTVVELTAVPDAGWTFNGWSGDTDTANANIVPLVIITGESNSGGYAVNGDASPTELSARPGVQILNNTSLLFEDLDIGTNNLIGHAGLSDNATHGFELGLANSVAASEWPNSPVYLVKTGQGGSTISQWAVGSGYWTTFNQRVTAAVNNITLSGKTPAIYIMYSHGINDAIAGTPVATWKNDTISHLAKVRRAVGPSAVLMTRLMSPTYDTYNTAIDEIASADALSSAIDVSGATLRDVNHWDYAGMKLISSRMITEMLASGGGSVTANPFSVTMNRNRSLTAHFVPSQYTLTYTAGAGGSISGTSPQTVNYGASGSAVTAVAAPGYHFVNWSDSSTANPRTDTNVAGSISVTANFAIDTYLLNVSSANGTVVSSPGGINCPGVCSELFTDGEVVTLTATPAAGYRFVNWSGGVNSSAANPTTVTMSAARTVTANYAINTISGTVSYATYSSGAKGVASVGLSAAGSIARSATTDSAGFYSMSGFGAGAYTVTPAVPATQPCLTSNGINALDSSLVQQQVVGLIDMTPYQKAAAKVTGTLTPVLTSFDAALIAQKSVGMCSPPNIRTGQWVITPASRTHAIVNNDFVDNFDAYMMGDVDGSWDPLGAMRPTLARVSDSPDAVQVGLPTMTGEAGTRVTVPMRFSNMMGRGVTSYQFDIQYDPSVIEPAELAADLVGAVPAELSIVSNSPEAGLLKVTVYGAYPATGDGVYANLHFNVRGASGTSSPLAIRGFMLNDDRWEVNATDGTISVGRVNAERPSIKGRVLTTDGAGVLNAIVTLTSTSGKIQSMRSGEGGTFEFNRVVAGETYTLTVQSKRFRYQPRTVSMTGNAVEIDVIPGK